MKQRIGFIGQGWIGRHYADDFERRGFVTTRYALEEPYRQNKDVIKECPIVFIAVPTPTTPECIDISAVKDALTLLTEDTIAVIKSTIPIGSTRRLQEMFQSLIVLHSPEFLVEKTASYDAAHPKRNIVGVPVDSRKHQCAAQKVLSVLPDAPYISVVSSDVAELIKYGGNAFLYTKVVFMNLLYDLAKHYQCDWEDVRAGVIHDARIGESHTTPQVSGKRGAGGHCFIKDFEAFRRMYSELDSVEGEACITAAIAYNNLLLQKTKKDQDLLVSVYGSTL